MRKEKGNDNIGFECTDSTRKCRLTAQWNRGLRSKEHQKADVFSDILNSLVSTGFAIWFF